MRILLTGASGFIGQRLAHALQARGHQVVCVVRRTNAWSEKGFEAIAADFARDHALEHWLPRLHGIDVVINAVGIIRERRGQTFEAIHVKGPKALFSACVEAKVRLIVQISALGADDEAQSAYHLSKKQADDYLCDLPTHAVIVQPSLVYGPEGASARLFTTLASLPVIAVPGHGEQRVQPVHVEDLVQIVLALVERPLPHGTRLPLVGPHPISIKELLATLRSGMKLGPARFLPIPIGAVRIAASAASCVSSSLLDRETLTMLERGNTADAGPAAMLIGGRLRDVPAFINDKEALAVRLQAQLNWLLPLLRLSIAVVWIMTAFVSFGLYPVADSYVLLSRVGITGALAPVMLYGAAVLDLAFGVATLKLKRRRLLWRLQIAVILGYTAIITLKLPEFWLHPYGPLVKNLPMLAAIYLLHELEKE